MKKMEDNILPVLTAEDLWLRSRGFGLSGLANAAGLAKLDQHPNVRGVWLEQRLRDD